MIGFYHWNLIEIHGEINRKSRFQNLYTIFGVGGPLQDVDNDKKYTYIHNVSNILNMDNTCMLSSEYYNTEHEQQSNT